jgi:hypothetical protein
MNAFFQAALHPTSARAACARSGRALANALAVLPGFLAVVVVENDPAAGAITVLCPFGTPVSITVAEGAIARWQRDAHTNAVPCIQRLGAGAVMAQKGL